MKLEKIFKKTEEEERAMGQFNFSTLEHYKAIVSASIKTKTPVILGTSESEACFVGLEEAVGLRDAARRRGAEVFLHLDHGKDFKLIKKAIEAGYDSVHFDGSLLSFEENLRKTEKVVKYAKKRNVFVEGELGVIRGGSDEKETPVLLKEEMTKPEKAREFVGKTGVNSLAICIGNVHGSYGEMPQLDLKRQEEIREKTDAFLVFHGGSGFSKEVLQKVIKRGIVKININTSLRRVWRRFLEEELARDKTVKPYKILSPVRKELLKKVLYFISLFKG